MNEDQNKEWPSGAGFLELVEAMGNKASEEVASQSTEFGVRLPKTFDRLGDTMSLLYKAATCGWGCRAGDHQAEWLIGRVVNQSMASYRLIRAGFYDESLMLTRGIGEIANLIWLLREPAVLEAWRSASRKERMKTFSPSVVRKSFHDKFEREPFINGDRYRMLCEVGTHPVPWTGPNLYTGGSRPILGHLLQPAGLLIAINELGYAVGIAAVPTSNLLGLTEFAAASLGDAGQALIASIGGVTIENYESLKSEAVKTAAAEGAITAV